MNILTEDADWINLSTKTDLTIAMCQDMQKAGRNPKPICLQSTADQLFIVIQFFVCKKTNQLLVIS